MANFCLFSGGGRNQYFSFFFPLFRAEGPKSLFWGRNSKTSWAFAHLTLPRQPPQHAKWSCDTPPQRGYLSDTCAIPYEMPPHKRGISAIPARYPMKTRQKACDTLPLQYYLERVLRDKGGVSRTGPLSCCPSSLHAKHASCCEARPNAIGPLRTLVYILLRKGQHDKALQRPDIYSLLDQRILGCVMLVTPLSPLYLSIYLSML